MTNEIGLRIKKLRKDNGLTLEEVGKYLKISKATVQRYESGFITEIPSDRIVLLAKLFAVSPSYIMGWKDKTLGTDTLDKRVGKSGYPELPLLNSQEEALLVAFHILNAEGKNKVLDYVTDLVNMPKYITFKD